MWVDPVCLICLKVIRNSGDSPTVCLTERESLLKKFVALSERLLSLPESVLSVFHLVVFREVTNRNACLCPDCEDVIRDACQLYQDLCAVQLKLGWRLKQLEESLESSNQLSSKLSSILEKRVAEQLDLPSGGPEQIRAIRRRLSRNCNRFHNSQRQVSIPLEQISHIGKVKANAHHTVVDTSASKSSCQIKVEKENDEADEDQEDYFSNFDFQSQTQDEERESADSSPPPTRVKKEESHPATMNLDQPAIDTSVGISKLRPRRISAKYFTKPNKAKNSKPVKKEATVIKLNRGISVPPIAEGVDHSELVCKVCNRHVSRNLRTLRKHLGGQHESFWLRKNKSKRPPLQCYFCHYSFAYEETRLLHLKLALHTFSLTRGKFICGEGNCNNIQFNSFTELDSHFGSNHSEETVYRCSLCEWPFLNDDMRQVHELIHVKVRTGDTYKCQKCEKEFTSVNTLQNHYSANHTVAPVQMKIYRCTLCNHRCKYVDVFQAHMKSHEIEHHLKMGIATASDFVTCKDCGKSFSNKKTFSRHRALHQKTQCSKCGKLIKTEMLSSHMKVIHKEGPSYPCPKCGKTFFARERVRRHIQQVHNPEAPRTKQCHICQKKYLRGALLYKHLKDVHQIEVEALKVPPKFICPECGKGYYHQASLDQHIDAKHTEESQRRWNYKCDICMKSFVRPCLLSKHMAEGHSTEPAQQTGDSDIT